jgi:hypothetical protein
MGHCWHLRGHGGVSFHVFLRFLILRETPMAPSQTLCVEIRNRIYQPMYLVWFALWLLRHERYRELATSESRMRRHPRLVFDGDICTLVDFHPRKTMFKVKGCEI